MIEPASPTAPVPGPARRPTALVAAPVSLAALIVAVVVFASPTLAGARPARTRIVPASVSVDLASPGAAVPPGFLGLSFEASSLGQIAAYAGRGDMVALLRSLGAGVLRFGGVSADTRVAWSEPKDPPPAWASSVVGNGQMRELGALAGESGWRVLLTLGLVHYEPEAAASEAAAARAALGESLAGIEIGNEPDAYAKHAMRPEPWTITQYDTEVTDYRDAIEAAAPGIPLAGPDVSGSGAFESWGLGEAINQRPALLTGHHYPLGCEQHPAPTIERLLSPRVRQQGLGSLLRYMAIAQSNEMPFRMDETNTVSCGGVPGISDTFASALWALGYITQAMQTGVSGINLEGNPGNCQGYTPVCASTPEALARGELTAEPEWYALLIARALVGERPLATSIASPEPENLQVACFLAEDGALHLVVIDDDPPEDRPVALELPLGPGFQGASILSLRAPSPTALSGITLGGRAVSATGSWSAPTRLPGAENRDGVITVPVAPSSAALLTILPRRPAAAAAGATGRG